MLSTGGGTYGSCSYVSACLTALICHADPVLLFNMPGTTAHTPLSHCFMVRIVRYNVDVPEYVSSSAYDAKLYRLLSLMR